MQNTNGLLQYKISSLANESPGVVTYALSNARR